MMAVICGVTSSLSFRGTSCTSLVMTLLVLLVISHELDLALEKRMQLVLQNSWTVFVGGNIGGQYWITPAANMVEASNNTPNTIQATSPSAWCPTFSPLDGTFFPLLAVYPQDGRYTSSEYTLWGHNGEIFTAKSTTLYLVLGGS